MVTPRLPGAACSSSGWSCLPGSQHPSGWWVFGRERCRRNEGSVSFSFSMGVATQVKERQWKEILSLCKKAEGFKAEGTGKKRAQNMHGKINYLGKKKMKPRRSELKQQQVILPW